MTTWICYRCLRSTGRRGRSLICTTCRQAIAASGLRWCARGKHAIDPAQFGKHTYCRACVSAEQRTRTPRRRTPEYRRQQRQYEKQRDPGRWRVYRARRKLRILRGEV